ncbi:MAG: hypothetical protein Q8K35_03765 [Thiobacillus sp.]|nr:hypothetical protein [Thiobacillus sp.]
MLTLNVPGTDPVLQHTVETRPKAVVEWLDRLPFASPADTAQQLVMALYALNRHPLGADERHALLALYRPVVARAVASLETLLAETVVAPHAQQRQTGTLLRELQIEHSIGYKQVLLALASRRFGRASPKRTAEVTARLLAALRDIPTACHLTYTPLPAGLWQEMHQIHAFAQASNLADNAVDDAPPASLAYCQALLIALADPPHMSHAELVHTRLYLDQFAALAVLTTAPVAGHRGFPIHAKGGAPPNPFAASPAQGGLWLDTDALCHHLHDTTVRLSTGETPRRIGLPPGMESELSQTLCKRLLKQWGTGTQRAFRRYAIPGSMVQIVAGVSAIHRLLEPVPQAARLEPDEADNLAITDVEPVFAAPVAVYATQWTVSNDSAAGLALSGTPDAPLNLKVGDPLAVRADAAAEWSLGVIRWIRMRDTRQVELGVERLSPQVQPVWVRPLRGHRKASPEPALFVPGLAALKQKDRLLLPRYLYQIGMDADVLHPPHQYTLTFGRRLAHTPSFDLIDFTVFAGEQP